MSRDPLPIGFQAYDFDRHFSVYHELMARKVFEILLVGSPYDAFIMEEDGSLAAKIVNEYSGLNLSRPPRLHRATAAAEALAVMADRPIDLVLTTPHVADADPQSVGRRLKQAQPGLPVALLVHSLAEVPQSLESGEDSSGIDRVLIWSGDADLLLALVKNTEDHMNVAADTRLAMVRVLILVEDSPLHRSVLLPLMYKEVVRQTQAVIGDSLNEEHRLLRMRARPKILVAETYEAAMALYRRFRPYVLGVISDTRFPKKGRQTADAGLQLLRRIKSDVAYLPLLLLSSESANREKAARIPVMFVDKNSPRLPAEIHSFFLTALGFGDFIFRTPDQVEIGRAGTLRELELLLPHIPDEPIYYQAKRNRFSNWFMARSEIALASLLKDVSVDDFDAVDDIRTFIIASIRALRRWRQQGAVARFSADRFDPDINEFVKVGRGSLGGKARGLAFFTGLLRDHPEVAAANPHIVIHVPKTLVVATDAYESFVAANGLERCNDDDSLSDEQITSAFLNANLPASLTADLTAYLSRVTWPLSIRSTSRFEDAFFQPFAGLYRTVMIPNLGADTARRLEDLIAAIKLVWASTCFRAARRFAHRTANRYQRDTMAVMVQQLVGTAYGDFFYPAVSGTVRSHNFYPFGQLNPEDGVALIALGLGQADGDRRLSLRFSPRYPEVLPHFSSVDDMLKNAQRRFLAMKLEDGAGFPNGRAGLGLTARDIDSAFGEYAVRALCSTYRPEEHRIRDAFSPHGYPVLTFAPMLKYNRPPLAGLLRDLIDLGRKGLGCPMEFEFALTLSPDPDTPDHFYLLQIRPMAAGEANFEVTITEDDKARAFCYSEQTLGHGRCDDMRDLVLIDPDRFDPSQTKAIAEEVGRLNAELASRQRPYLLAGPGRWGSSDPWLGIPVRWRQISGAHAVVELQHPKLIAAASEGSHFFHNLTAHGVHYFTVNNGTSAFFRFEAFADEPVVQETPFCRHMRFGNPMQLKNDGRRSHGTVSLTLSASP